MLSGYKTYVCAAVCFLAGVCYALGWITQDQLNAILAIFGPLTVAALRAGVTKSGSQ